MDLSGVGIWSSQLGYGNADEAANAAAELEELGFTALWIPDVGGPVLDSVEHLLASTNRTVIATGILNLWMHKPSDVAASYASLTNTHGARFLLGIGCSHAALIDSKEPGRYRRPLAATRAFLDALDATEQPVPAENRVLAALGPKMLELSATRAGGAHPYLVTPDHTRQARTLLGAGPLLLPEQTVLLTDDHDEAPPSEPTGCVPICIFGAKLQRYMYDYEIPTETLAQVAEKAFANGSITPHARRRRPLSADEILGSQMLAHPLAQYTLCSPGEGAAALVCAAREYLDRLRDARPGVAALGFPSGRGAAGSFEVFSPSLGLEIADSPTVDAARRGVRGGGRRAEGRGRRAGAGHGVRRRAHPSRRVRSVRPRRAGPSSTRGGGTRIDGELPVNTDGGCLANGEPVGASGLRQVYEVVAQLRGEAGERQVPGEPRVGFTQVYGAPGVSACTVVSR